MKIRVWLRALAETVLRRKRLVELDEAVRAHRNVLPVAGAQLRDASRQVEEGVTRLSSNFGRMMDRVREGASDAARLVRAGGEEGGEQGVAGLLNSSQAALEGLLTRIVGDSEICRELLGRLGGLERDMGQIVQALADVDRISFGNTILALNAKIEAAHMGERGRGFEIVAQELWTQSQHSEQITENIRAAVARLASGAKAAAGDVGRMVCSDHAQIAALEAQVHQALERLKGANQQTERVVEAGEERNKVLADEIAGAVEAIQFQDRVNQQVGHIVEALEGLQQALEGGCQLGGPAPAALAALSDSYTMESERSVHAAVLGRAAEGEEAVDNNIELF